MPPREVLVTYTLYPSGNGDLRTALAGVTDQFPLRNLHWKSSTRTALRTIQEADVHLVELGDVPPPMDPVAGSVLELPLVNICFVACDDSDLYKNNTRTFIKDWLALLSSRRGSQVPLIVLVNPPSASGAPQSSKNVFGRDRGIIAKLKTDFNTTKRDICSQIFLPPAGTTDPAAWPDIINKLKESVVQAFDAAIIEREEEVKRGEAQRVTPNWNFFSWFLLKESLAHSFEGVNLFEDALLIYEELDAAFVQALKENSLKWFGRLGATDPLDDSLSILDPAAKPYRELLISSTISVFDFRIYVFARQCILLGKIGRITEIAKRGQWFIASLARRLRDSEATLPEYFVESWTYNACMDLVAHCDEWSRVDRPNNDYSGLIAYESARSELLDIARVQIERIGVMTGNLPNKYPFQPILSLDGKLSEISLKDEDEAQPQSTPKNKDSPLPKPPLSNEVLVGALQSQESFLQLFANLTEQALAAYEACGKVNSAVRLKTDLAALSMHSEDWTTAYDLFRSLSRDCAELRVWDRVAKYALEGALFAHTELQKPRDDDWANLALAYLRVCSVAGLTDNERAELQTALAGLRKLPQPRQVSDNPVFHLRLIDNAASLCSDVSVTQLTLQVTNTLPVEVEVDDVWLELDSETYGTIVYSSGATTIAPGVQIVTVSCSSSIGGPVTLREACVALGPVGFVTSYPKGQVIVPVHRNLQGLRAVLRMPSIISLDEESQIVLEVHSGKQAVKAARLAISPLQNEVTYDLARATTDGKEVEASEDSIGLGDLDEDTVILISIPYSGMPRSELAKIQIVIQYTSSEGVESNYIDEQSVFMGLPITVNVQDFFRPEALVSSFAIASDGREYVRISSVNLVSPSDTYAVDACRSKWDSLVLVSPSQPMSCLFKVRPKGPPTSEVLRLAIQYQTIEDEVELAAQAALSTLALPSAPLSRAVRSHIAERALWLQRYLLSGELATIFDANWSATVPSSAKAALEKFLAALGPAAPRWRTLCIPVEVPLRRLLTTVRLTPATTDAIHEGRALAFDVEFSTSLSWLGATDTNGDDEAEGKESKTYRVTYDVQASGDDWIVVGKKRGVYTADASQSEKQTVVLVPVRHGTLSLPPVSVQLVETRDLSSSQMAPRHDRVHCETYVANAAQGVRVLPAKTGMTALVPIAPDWDE